MASLIYIYIFNTPSDSISDALSNVLCVSFFSHPCQQSYLASYAAGQFLLTPFGDRMGEKIYIYI